MRGLDKIIATFKLSPVACVIFVAFLLMSLAAFQRRELMIRWMMRPYDMIRYKKWWMLITSGFIHANIQHLIMNGLTFYFIAFELENQMVRAEISQHEGPGPWVLIGHVKFFILYFAALIISDLTTAIKYKDDQSYSSLGASGAISALVISFIIFLPDVRFWGVIPGWALGIGYLAYSYIAARMSRDNIGHEAHLWGGIVGLVFTPLMFPDRAMMVVEQIKSLF